MLRNEVWWAELPKPAGPRPVLILTRNAILESIDSIVVALVTRTIRNLPTEVRLGRKEGLPRPCVVNLDNLLTVPKRRLTRLMGALGSAKTDELNDALKLSLELS
jgi:mRNA interferase MazF